MEVPPGSGRIGILGPVELMGEEPVPLGGVKERCLLAAMAVRCGEAVGAAGLVDALWGDDPPRTAAKTLQNYVLRVRRALARAGGPAIVTLPDGYCLRAVPTAVDAGLAESLTGEGRRQMAVGDPAGAAGLLSQALELWRGPALAEFADRPFAAAEALRLDELREAALEDLFDAELALGRHHEVIGGLEALVASGPLRERRWGQLMVALYRGRRRRWTRSPGCGGSSGRTWASIRARSCVALTRRSCGSRPSSRGALSSGRGSWPGGGISAASGRCLACSHALTTPLPGGAA